MAGLDPAIHVLASAKKGVDARVKPGHDEQWDAQQEMRPCLSGANNNTATKPAKEETCIRP
jgi:hypothetical protein